MARGRPAEAAAVLEATVGLEGVGDEVGGRPTAHHPTRTPNLVPQGACTNLVAPAPSQPSVSLSRLGQMTSCLPSRKSWRLVRPRMALGAG